MELDELHEGVSQSLSKDRNLGETRALVGDSIAQTRETATQQRRATALRMGSLAAAGHHAAADLEEHFPQFARYIHDAAAGFEPISNFLRDPNLDEMATFVAPSVARTYLAAEKLAPVGFGWLACTLTTRRPRERPSALQKYLKNQTMSPGLAGPPFYRLSTIEVSAKTTHVPVEKLVVRDNQALIRFPEKSFG